MLLHELRHSIDFRGKGTHTLATSLSTVVAIVVVVVVAIVVVDDVFVCIQFFR